MRREPRGTVVERFEPEDMTMMEPLAPHDKWEYGPQNRPLLREALYNHYQHEKYTGECSVRPCLPSNVDMEFFQRGGRCRIGPFIREK
jgi:hypothetical protein